MGTVIVYPFKSILLLECSSYPSYNSHSFFSSVPFLILFSSDLGCFFLTKGIFSPSCKKKETSIVEDC